MHFRIEKSPANDATAASISSPRAGRGNRPFGGFALLAVLVPVLSAGCEATIDKRRHAEGVATYLTKPLRKALYVNTADFAMYPRWGGSDADQALALAERDCKESSAKRGSPPDRCAPFYLDDVRLVDPDLYE